MDELDKMLTSQAIAELMQEMQGQNNAATQPLQERKINPLGKPNKRFLGRTINTALRHNKRETERTHASCQQKLQELDDRWERRRRNAYFNGEGSVPRAHPKHMDKRRSQSHSGHTKSELKHRSRSHSRSHKKKHKKEKKHKKYKKSKRIQRSVSHQSEAATNSEDSEQAANAVNNFYAQHTENMALAVAMAYNQALSAQVVATETPIDNASASPTSDIMKELMSDGEADQIELLSIATSSDGEQQVLTIDVSSNSDTENSDDDSSGASSNCISLDDSVDEVLPTGSGSDIEIVDSTHLIKNVKPLHHKQSDQGHLDQKQSDHKEELQPKQLPIEKLSSTIDLTDD